MLPQLAILNSGSNERLKAGVHGAALGLAVVMGLYNGAAWLRRRERHLAVNTVLYAALMAWEQKLVSHHLAKLRTDDDLALGTGRTRPQVTPRLAGPI